MQPLSPLSWDWSHWLTEGWSSEQAFWVSFGLIGFHFALPKSESCHSILTNTCLDQFHSSLPYSSSVLLVPVWIVFFLLILNHPLPCPYPTFMLTAEGKRILFRSGEYKQADVPLRYFPFLQLLTGSSLWGRDTFNSSYMGDT